MTFSVGDRVAFMYVSPLPLTLLLLLILFASSNLALLRLGFLAVGLVGAESIPLLRAFSSSSESKNLGLFALRMADELGEVEDDEGTSLLVTSPSPKVDPFSTKNLF